MSSLNENQKQAYLKSKNEELLSFFKRIGDTESNFFVFNLVLIITILIKLYVYKIFYYFCKLVFLKFKFLLFLILYTETGQICTKILLHEGWNINKGKFLREKSFLHEG